MKPELPLNETERLAWLRECRILDTETEPEFDELTRLAAQVCGVPMAAISLIDEERQWFKSVVGINVRETPRDVAFCAHTILDSNLLIVEDAATDVRFADSPLVLSDPHIRFYAGAPLINSEGHALGALCVIDHAPRRLSAEQEAILKVLAAQVSGRMELQRRIALQEHLIDERNRVQRELLQRDGELTAIVEHAREAIFLVDPATKRILKCNAALRTTLGYTDAELKSSTLYQIVGHVRSSIDHDISAVCKAEALALGERQYLRRNGTVIIVDVTARAISYDGRTAICFVAHDMTPERTADTARRLAEENFKSLFEHAAEGIFQTTPEGQYLRVNPALARLYGYELPQQLIRELVDISNQLYVDEGRRAEFQRLMAKNASIVGFELEVRRRDGSTIWISESARVVRNDHDHVSYYEGFVQDISDRIAFERQRERDLREAQLRADLDSLTELWNHRAFHNLAEQCLSNAELDGRPQAVVMLDIDNFKFFNDLYGHATGDEVLRMVAGRLQTMRRPCDILARFGGDEFAILIGDVGQETREDVERDLTEGLSGLTFYTADREVEVPITVSLGAAVSPSDGVCRLELLHAADERLRWAKTGGQADRSAEHIRDYLRHAIDGFSMLDALLTAVDNKDRYTRRHSEDVMVHCLTIASKLGLDKSEQHNLAVAALLHDVGKIGVPDAIWRKPGKLTDVEYAAVKLHPQMGAAIVSAVFGLEATLDAVRHHHENYDGSGYPSGLTGTEIPLIARIMAVADAYSAMTMDRPYRKGLNRARALSILKNEAGKRWDGTCVAAFLDGQDCWALDHKYSHSAA